MDLNVLAGPDSWSLDKFYQVEPDLKEIAARTVAQRRRRVRVRYAAYEAAKKAAWGLLGWCARDPQLQSSGAWDCFFRYIVDQLRI